MGSAQYLRKRWHQSRALSWHRLAQPRFTDIRLLPAALSLWCFTALTHLYPFRVALIFLLLLAFLLCLSYRPLTLRISRISTRIHGGLQACLAFALLLCSLQAVIMVGKDYPARLALLQELNGQGIRLAGQVVNSEPATRGGYRTTVATHQLSKYPSTYEAAISLHIYTEQLFVPGSSVTGVGRFRVQGSYYSVKGALRHQGGAPSAPAIFLLKNELRAKATREIGADEAGLVLGMAYGDDTPLSEQAVNALRASGLTHLTAVSGSNITLIFVLAYRLVQQLGLPRLLLICSGLGAATLYVSVVGPDGSVLRAWTMGLLGAVGLVLGHGAYRLTLLSSCLIGLLFISPELATDYGFVLSVTATASLMLLAPAITRLLCHIFPLLWAEVLALPLAASLWCAPVILLLSESFYPYTVLANILVAPFVAPITLAGLAALLASSQNYADQAASFFLQCGGLGAQTVHWVSRWCYDLPGSRIPLEVSPHNLLLTLFGVAAVSAIVLVTDARINAPQDSRVPALFDVGGSGIA